MLLLVWTPFVCDSSSLDDDCERSYSVKMFIFIHVMSFKTLCPTAAQLIRNHKLYYKESIMNTIYSLLDNSFGLKGPVSGVTTTFKVS